MAQPIVYIPSPKNEAGSKDHLRDAAERHADAIASALEALQLLHDRGVLDLLRGMLGAGDQLIEKLTTAVDAPETIRAIRNFILMTKLFSSIPPDVLSGLVKSMTEGAEQERAHSAPGLLQLLWRLRSENSRRALGVALDLVEGVGKGL